MVRLVMEGTSRKEINAMVVAFPFPISGGGYRALLSIKGYKKRGVKTSIVLPWSALFDSNIFRGYKKILFDLNEEGVSIAGSLLLPRIFYRRLPLRRTIACLVASYLPSQVKLSMDYEVVGNPACAISMHENFDSLITACLLAKKFSIPRVAILQLPPFYGLKNRAKNIRRALHLWTKVTSSNPLMFGAQEFHKELVNVTLIRKIKSLLEESDLVISVSKSIPIEMGSFWEGRIRSLDPGVALSDEDLRLIEVISRTTQKNKKWVIFGGGPTPEKGTIEALIAWKMILRKLGRDFKLVITGSIQSPVLSKLKIFCHKIGINDSVLFTGYVPREERLRLVARAKMMLYPSHVDAFPYAILEALSLNTSVVAYNIPALKIYYNGLKGVTLVEESDILLLAQESIKVIKEKKESVEKPSFNKRWDEILDEETSLIKALMAKH